MGKEKLYENKIKKYLDSINAYYIKTFANSYTKAGIPDICATIDGHSVWIEVKAEKGKPSELQEYHLKEINKAGGFGILLYPSGFERFKKEIEYYRQNKCFLIPNYNGYIKFKRGWYE